MSAPSPEYSYERHRQHYGNLISQGDFQLPTANSVARWDANGQQTRILAYLDDIITSCPGASWLTIGDGRYGAEAQYIKAHGGRALATDISDTLLKIAKNAGRIDAYEVQNAECLTCPDRSYDFVSCKAAAHHFPRPAVAIYEMMRVAKQAVVMIEPADPYICDKITEWPLTHARRFVNWIINGRNGRNDYESVGNYLYKFSVRELEKIVLAMGLPALAYAPINVFHIHKKPGEKPSSTHLLRRHIERMRPLLVGFQDILTRLSLLQPVEYAFVIFVSPPPKELRAAMKKNHFRFMKLPRNPFCNSI